MFKSFIRFFTFLLIFSFSAGSLDLVAQDGDKKKTYKKARVLTSATAKKK